MSSNKRAFNCEELELKGHKWENTFEADFNKNLIDLENFNFHYIDDFSNLSVNIKNGVEKLRFAQYGSKYYPMVACQIKSFHDNMVKVVGMFPNLTQLTLENYPLFTDDQFASINHLVLKRLTALSLTKNSSLSHATFKRISRNCNSLQSLAFNCRFYVGVNFTAETNNLQGERYLHFNSDDLSLLLFQNLQLKHISLMMNEISNQVLETIGKSISLERIDLIVEEISSSNLKFLVGILLSPLITRFSVSLKLQQFIMYNENKVLYLSNVFTGEDSVEFWKEHVVVICSVLQDLKSIELHEILLSDELCDTICLKQTLLKHIVCSDCRCFFVGGFVDKFVRACKLLEFLFIMGKFESPPATMLTFIDDRAVVALVVDKNLIDGEQIRLLRKTIRELKGGAFVLDYSIECHLRNNSIGNSADDETDDEECVSHAMLDEQEGVLPEIVK
jgi:hypothetical protein